MNSACSPGFPNSGLTVFDVQSVPVCVVLEAKGKTSRPHKSPCCCPGLSLRGGWDHCGDTHRWLLVWRGAAGSRSPAHFSSGRFPRAVQGPLDHPDHRGCRSGVTWDRTSVALKKPENERPLNFSFPADGWGKEGGGLCFQSLQCCECDGGILTNRSHSRAACCPLRSTAPSQTWHQEPHRPLACRLSPAPSLGSPPPLSWLPTTPPVPEEEFCPS